MKGLNLYDDIIFLLLPVRMCILPNIFAVLDFCKVTSIMNQKWGFFVGGVIFGNFFQEVNF